jgi:hypothetical protein
MRKQRKIERVRVKERERERRERPLYTTFNLLYVARIHSRKHKEDRVLQREKRERKPHQSLYFYFYFSKEKTAQERRERWGQKMGLFYVTKI